MKPKFLNISQRYDASGNGNNMPHSHNKDDGMCSGHANLMFCNQQNAMRKVGEDPAAFLRFECTELLCWWHVALCGS